MSHEGGSNDTITPFPPPWQVEQTPGGFKVLDASGQTLVTVRLARCLEANIAGMLTFDDARRTAVNVAKLRPSEESKRCSQGDWQKARQMRSVR